MNFDFSDDTRMLQQEARRFLADRAPMASVRGVLDGKARAHDAALWSALAELGWQGLAVPEAYGGLGYGHEGLCVLAEELGAALCTLPFLAATAQFGAAIARFGSDGQKASILPALAAGELVGALAFAEGPGEPDPQHLAATVSGGRLTGEKWPVPDAEDAGMAVVAAKGADGTPGLYLVDLTAGGVERTALRGIDPTRPVSRLAFDGAPAQPLGGGAGAFGHVLDHAAIVAAFEQIGGARAALDLAADYARERHAFGRPIGSFQAIKHRLADIYVKIELARSNAYYGVWALEADAPDLPAAAAAARIAASDAFFSAARELIQVFGGMGFTWEADCHLFYRRAKMLSVALGSAPFWKDALISRLEAGARGH